MDSPLTESFKYRFISSFIEGINPNHQGTDGNQKHVYILSFLVILSLPQ